MATKVKKRPRHRTRQSVTSRTIDIDYEDVLVQDYINELQEKFGDTAYIKNAQPLLKNDIKTFSFPLESLLPLYLNSLDFRTLVKSNRYIWVDNRLCINNKECFAVNNGKLTLSKKVLADPLKYCITMNAKQDFYFSKIYTEKPLVSKLIDCLSAVAACKSVTFNEPPYSAEIITAGINQEKFVEELARYCDIGGGGGNPPPSNPLNEIITSYKKLYNYSDAKLGKAIGTDGKTIERLRKDMIHRTNIETVIATCLILNIPPYISDNVIKLAGYTLRDNEQENAYKVLLGIFWECDVEMHIYNKLLLLENLKPLSSLLVSEETSCD